MSFASNYINKQVLFQSFIDAPCAEDTGIIITIPCINEPDIIRTLNSLKQCSRPSCSVEVIVHINSGENAHDEVVTRNENSYIEVKNWISENNTDKIQFHALKTENLPKKHAGAGLARKIAMDEAVRRFDSINNPAGVICGFDADSLCSKNYFTEIENAFKKDINAASFYFEHPVSGTEFSNDIYFRITQYELYLRYYVQIQRLINFPFAYHTIGSSFGVRAEIYCKQGGMNRKTAGEDFYFLQKIIPLGKFEEINTLIVTPSPRPSDRVPFGTGAAISKLITEVNTEYDTYNPKAFYELGKLFANTEVFFKCNNTKEAIDGIKMASEVSDFLYKNKFEEAINEMNKQSPSVNSFNKRFYQWFNAFRVLKYLNFVHESHFNKVPLLQAASETYQKISGDTNYYNYSSLLEKYRCLERRC